MAKSDKEVSPSKQLRHLSGKLLSPLVSEKETIKTLENLKLAGLFKGIQSQWDKI